jgi:hypothetical protein
MQPHLILWDWWCEDITCRHTSNLYGEWIRIKRGQHHAPTQQSSASAIYLSRTHVSQGTLVFTLTRAGLQRHTAHPDGGAWLLHVPGLPKKPRTATRAQLGDASLLGPGSIDFRERGVSFLHMRHACAMHMIMKVFECHQDMSSVP